MNTAARIRKSHAHALASRSVWEWTDHNSSGEIVTWGDVDPDALAERIAREGASYFDDIRQSSIYSVRVRRVQVGASRRIDWRTADRRGAPEGRGSVELHPAEPGCESADGHDWVQSGSPVGDGAGVRYHEECAHCRALKTTRTNRRDGGGCFFDSVEFADE